VRHWLLLERLGQREIRDASRPLPRNGMIEASTTRLLPRAPICEAVWQLTAQWRRPTTERNGSDHGCGAKRAHRLTDPCAERDLSSTDRPSISRTLIFKSGDCRQIAKVARDGVVLTLMRTADPRIADPISPQDVPDQVVC